VATTATRFDAASDRVTYTGGSGAPPTPSAGWSASWWAYISTDRNDFSTMLRLHASSGGSTVLNLAMSSSGTAPGAFTAGGTVQVSTQLTVATWYYLAYSVSSTTATIYVFDTAGALVTSVSGTIGGGTPDALTVGGRSAGDSTEWFDGRISRLRIWSRVLTQAQFAAEQFATNPVGAANLWEHWPLTGAGDLSGAAGGHNLTAGTTATTTEAGPPLSTTVTGSATAALGGLAATVNGRRGVLGVAAAPVAGLSATVAGKRVVRGAAGASLGGPSGNVAAVRSVLASVSATLAGLGVTATGRRAVTGAAGAPLRSLGVAALGVRTVRATVAVPLGGLGATAIASRNVRATAAVSIAALTTAATGRRTVRGAATNGLGAATVTTIGRRSVLGDVVAPLGGLHVVVIIGQNHNATVHARLRSQGRVHASVGRQRVRAALGAQR
jgi:hypothetical protein